jgi:hypothetical protein
MGLHSRLQNWWTSLEPQRALPTGWTPGPDGKPVLASMNGVAIDGDQPVAVVSARPRAMVELSDWLAANGAAVVTVTALESVSTGRTPSGDTLLALFVDLDGAGDVEEVVNQLLILREDRPGLPIILCSADFLGDDLDTSRLSICDVSLRWPVSIGSARRGLAAAIENNRLWQARTRRPV